MTKLRVELNEKGVHFTKNCAGGSLDPYHEVADPSVTLGGGPDTTKVLVQYYKYQV